MQGKIRNRNRKTKNKFEEKVIQMKSFEKIHEVRGSQDENFRFEAKTIKDGVWLSEKLEHFRNSHKK